MHRHVCHDDTQIAQLLLDSVLENQSQLKLEDRLYDTDLDQLFHN